MRYNLAYKGFVIRPDTTKMEKIKEIIENKSFQRIILLSCFILSAIFLLLFISQVYSFISSDNPPIDNQNKTAPAKIAPPPKDDFFRGMPKDSPVMLILFLLGFLIPLLAGIIIYDHLGKKEKKSIKNELIKTKKEVKSKVINKILLPEEKIVIDLLKDNSGTLTQSELVKKSNLNKLKISRVLKKLESLNLIEKYPYGMTNKIKLKN
jgi:hypothetical protein